MGVYRIRGVEVKFPFDAYDCQIAYMESVIRSLQEGSNALLESPTGTGKTLCLLCASLAWREGLGSSDSPVVELKMDQDSKQSGQRDLPTIIYTSRTHSQLQQVIQELKRSPYRPKTVVLGSREQMCIHEKVKKLHGTLQNNSCHSLRKRRACYHYNCVADYVKKNQHLEAEILDIEEMVNIGKTNGPCPYFLSRELHKGVDIIFSPYNYIIDPKNRHSLTGIQWENTVLIFDEAHNLDSICSEAASFDLTTTYLSACISEASHCGDLCNSKSTKKLDDQPLDAENFAILGALLRNFEEHIRKVSIQSKDAGFTRPGFYIYDFLKELNITRETYGMLLETIKAAALLLEDEANTSGLQPSICKLKGLGEILEVIFRKCDKSLSNYYRVHVRDSEQHRGVPIEGIPCARTLSWWCFNPGIAMEELASLGVRSIILTSGTLSPLDSLALEFKLQFPVRLENPHVISSHQVWVGVVPTGPSGCAFNSSYHNRDSLEYQQELGNSIVNFARIIPDGLLVFFPSYYLMDKCIKCWQNKCESGSKASSSIWERISRHKHLIVEPRDSALFSEAIESYKAKLNESSRSGAVFFAVCRGKVSEGMDFADHAGRAVIITGIPYAMNSDPKVRLKREFLDAQTGPRTHNQKVLTGEEWYSQQASRAVNQAIGRVIRHRNDYGAIILCDERFAQQNRQGQLPAWIRPHVKCYSRFGDAVCSLTKFFDVNGTPNKRPTLFGNPFTGNAGLCSTNLSTSAVETAAYSGKAVSLHESSAIAVNTASELSKLVQGKCSERPIVPNSEMSLFSSKTILPPTNRTTSNFSGIRSVEPLSSTLATKRVHSQNCMQIVPANRSSLNSGKSKKRLMQNYSIDEKALQRAIAKERPEHVFSEAIECSSMSPLNVQLKEKAPRFLDNGAKLFDKTPDSTIGLREIKYESNSIHGSGGEILETMKSSSDGGSFEHRRSNSKSTSGLLKSDGNDTTTQIHTRSSVPQDNDKTLTASDFLCQVKGMLTPLEYTHFVGYMKALKSRSMNLNSVLESVSLLFSAPERLILLRRFKEFVPGPFIPLFEKYLELRLAEAGELM